MTIQTHPAGSLTIPSLDNSKADKWKHQTNPAYSLWVYLCLGSHISLLFCSTLLFLSILQIAMFIELSSCSLILSATSSKLLLSLCNEFFNMATPTLKSRISICFCFHNLFLFAQISYLMKCYHLMTLNYPKIISLILKHVYNMCFEVFVHID